MLFTIQAERPHDGDKQKFLFDNETNELSTLSGFVFERGDIGSIQCSTPVEVVPFGKDVPLKKSKKVRVLKIQLGLSCNYSCDYCSQRFVERPPETNKKDIEEFLEKLAHLDLTPEQGLKIEFWGGEPFVYWKTLRPLVDALNEKFKDWPKKPQYSVITNGSLLNEEICDWLFENKFSVAISHDGPGQGIRGPDPFEDPKTKDIVLKFYRRQKRANRGISFNAMMNVHNMSRKAVHDWFIDFTGDFTVTLGEGRMIDAYDADGRKNALQTKAEHFKYRQISFADCYDNEGNIGFSMLVDKVNFIVQAITAKHNTKYVGQKCGMDREDVLSIDLRGNVITCQNVSAAETAGNGESHLGGHITNMDAVEIKTATHWRNRKDCSSCPVVQVCQGSCMYLQGENWETSCDNSYSDCVALWALAFEKITGYVPVFFENEHLPDDRRDIFGNILEHKEEPKKIRFPIKVVTEQKQIVVNDIPVFEKARIEEKL